jgi:hypothetical protein
MTTITRNGTHHHRGLHPFGWISQAFATHRQRLHLEELDDHMLADIGLNRADAEREAARPFWDLS